MKNFLKTFINLEDLAYWLLSSKETAEFINSFENVKHRYENEMTKRKSKFSHDTKLIERLNIGKVSKREYNPDFDKPLIEFEIINKN